MSVEIFRTFNNWVVIGDISNESKYAHKILKKLKNNGLNANGVHPKGVNKIFKSLKEVPYKIEAIDLCINSAEGLKYIKEANSLGIKNILIQPGAESKDILDYCIKNNLNAVQGCALVDL